jgi:DNA-binding NarL/FixJ family response regulator
VVLEIEARLEAADHVYYGEEVPVNNAPSSMIYCPKEEDDVASAVECLRSAAGNIPIIVLGSRLDPQLAQKVLLAGAGGVVNLERYPGQGARFLIAAFEDDAAISRDFLKAILAEAASRTGPIVLTPRQRQFLNLVIQPPLVADHIMVPKELLRAFLVEVEGRLEEEPFSDLGGRSPVA